MQALEESDWSFQQGTGCTRVGTQVSPAVVKAMLGDGREMRSAQGRGRASQQRALRRGSPV